MGNTNNIIDIGDIAQDGRAPACGVYVVQVPLFPVSIFKLLRGTSDSPKIVAGSMYDLYYIGVIPENRI